MTLLKLLNSRLINKSKWYKINNCYNNKFNNNSKKTNNNKIILINLILLAEKTLIFYKKISISPLLDKTMIYTKKQTLKKMKTALILLYKA
jgi:hypothetical protein